MKLYIPPHDLVRYWMHTRRRFREPVPALDARWASIKGDWPVPNPAGIFFTACDLAYFRLYAEPYIASIASSGGSQSVHLHVYDADDRALQDAREWGERSRVPVTVTRDPWDAPELHSEFLFAAGRFVLLPLLLRATRSPVVCTDVDVLVRGSIDRALRRLDGDVSLHLRPGNSLPWRKVLASTVIALPTSAAQQYFDAVAATLAEILSRPLTHHIDQTILYLAYLQTRSRAGRSVRFAPMDKELIDWDFGSTSLIWNAKGPQRKPAYWEAVRTSGMCARTERAAQC